MATQWHYRRAQESCGPVSFNELIRLVRGEQLSTDDLVREEWNSDWRPAALAVGLFHMAGRQDLFDKWEAEQAEIRRREEEARAAELAAAEAELPAWEQRLREVEAERLALEAAERAELEADLAANATRTEIDETLAAALEEIERRERELDPTRLGRLWRALTSPRALHLAFRWSLTLAAPNLVALALLDWSQTEAQRYPDPRAIDAGVKHFPVWGQCDSGMYYFLLADAMLAGAVAAHVAARILERLTDD